MPTLQALLARRSGTPYYDVHLECGQRPVLRVHDDLEMVSDGVCGSAQLLDGFRERALPPHYLARYAAKGDTDAGLTLSAQRFF